MNQKYTRNMYVHGRVPVLSTRNYTMLWIGYTPEQNKKLKKKKEKKLTGEGKPYLNDF